MTNEISTPSSWVGRAAKCYLRAKQRRLVQMAERVVVPELGTKLIPLLNEKYAIVDESDYEFLNQWNWRSKEKGYVTAYIGGIPVYMHRKILNVTNDRFVDHADHNPLNNVRSNLRICTSQQNQQNRSKRIGTTSRFKGVSWDKVNNLFIARLTIGYKSVNFGRFKTEEEAALRYNEAAKRHFGEFACLNQI